MIVAKRALLLDGARVEAGQVLDGIWGDLRERTRRALLANNWVGEEVATAAPPAPVTPPKRKRGRPKKVKEPTNA